MAQSHQRPFSRRQLAVIAKIAFIEAMALSLIIPTISSTGEITQPNICSSSNGLCSPIRFDSFVYGNSTLIDVTQLSSQAHSIIANESIVVVARGEVNTVKVSSVKDTALDTFTRIISPFGGDDLEIWTTITSQALSNIITVTWNNTNNAMFGASYYFNVRSIGNSTTSTGLASPSTVTLETIQSGSWVTGGFGISDSCSAFTVTVGVQRGQVCNSSVNDNSIVSLDNATTLANNVFSTMKATYSLVGSFDGAAVELIASDQEPNNPNFNNFCQSGNSICIKTQYSINQVSRTSFSSAVNKALALNTAYCTGITTSPLTNTLNHPLDGWGEYAGVDLNQTGARMLIQFYISTNVPSTVFASGLCASGGTVIGTSTIYFSTSGGLLSSNVFAMPINAFAGPTLTTGTYYGWFEITAENFVSGSMGWDQTTGGACANVCLYIINLMEIK